MAEPFSLSYPADAKITFALDDGLRRVAKAAKFSAGARVLHFGCGNGAATLLLAREFGCAVTAVDTDEALLKSLREKVRSHNVGDRVQVKALDPAKLSFPDADFEGVLCDLRLPLRLEPAAVQLRRVIAPKGRLAMIYPVVVGRQPNPGLVQFWEKRIGESLRLPREALSVVEAAGYEPQSVETLPDAELDDFYRTVESGLDSVEDPKRVKLLHDEIALHRGQGGRSTVTFASLIARRKEPGEKPPPSRSDG
jgi:ubiquinone/menaquinone biosynthesis C-methylase UbiE